WNCPGLWGGSEGFGLSCPALWPLTRLPALSSRSARPVDRSCRRFLALIRVWPCAYHISGATENFIDQSTWARLGIGRRELPKTLTLYNVDGSENKAGQIRYYCWLRILHNGNQRLQRFYIAEIGGDRIILGYPFLYAFNPKINWQKAAFEEGEVTIQTPRYKYHYRDILELQKQAIKQVGKPKVGEAIYLRRTNVAQEWARDELMKKRVMTMDTIPEEYKRHYKVFS